MSDTRRIPSVDELWTLLRTRNNWGRWGVDDQLGAANLITPAKRVAAARLVRLGRSISLSREFPCDASVANPTPAQHIVMQQVSRRSGGMVLDYYGIAYHGIAATHLDALCHVWDEDGMWGGRDPAAVLSTGKVAWGGVDHWSDGLATRGVLFDVPAHRGVDYVDIDEPVHGWELAEIAERNHLKVTPGDALVVYSGRDAYSRHRGEWGGQSDGCSVHTSTSTANFESNARPGLHASCLEYIRETDCSMLVWDMMDATPIGYDGLAWSVHAAVWAFGIVLVDNALLEPLAQACREHGVHDFLLSVAPLRVQGGTGSPVNPIVLL